MNNPIRILKTELLSHNWNKLKRITFESPKRDGSTEMLDREVYERGNGATILLYNRAQRSVILTRQFRLPTYLSGNKTGMMIEACAGMLDEDNAEECIRRETEEETGYAVNDVRKVFEAYMSPGAVMEMLHFYVAEYSPEMKVSEGGGLEHEGEHIEVLEMNFDKAYRMIETGEIIDGKTIILLQYLKINRII